MTNIFLSLKQNLIRAVIDTFGEMTFIDVLPQPDVSQKEELNNNNTGIFSIRIEEPFTGILYLFIPQIIIPIISENMTGMSASELNTQQMNDAVLELLNVITGNFLHLEYGKEKKYYVDIPLVGGEIPEFKDDSSCWIKFFAEDIPFWVGIKITSLYKII